MTTVLIFSMLNHRLNKINNLNHVPCLQCFYTKASVHSDSQCLRLKPKGAHEKQTWNNPGTWLLDIRHSRGYKNPPDRHLVIMDSDLMLSHLHILSGKEAFFRFKTVQQFKVISESLCAAYIGCFSGLQSHALIAKTASKCS